MSLAEGTFYYFLRPSGAQGLGHMGWGLRFSESLWLFGSLENIDSNMSVEPGGRNDYWYAWGESEARMLHEMRSMSLAEGICQREDMSPYVLYKKIPVTNANALAAMEEAFGQRGYGLVLNNCLDNAARVGDAYGVPVWSWGRHGLLELASTTPNGYFDVTLWQYTAYEL